MREWHTGWLPLRWLSRWIMAMSVLTHLILKSRNHTSSNRKSKIVLLPLEYQKQKMTAFGFKA